MRPQFSREQVSDCRYIPSSEHFDDYAAFPDVEARLNDFHCSGSSHETKLMLTMYSGLRGKTRSKHDESFRCIHAK